MPVADQPISLTLGDLVIAGEFPPVAGYTISALADDATWGNPQPVEVVIQTLLQQGSSVETDRYDNREAFIRVRIEADDGVSLAEGEAALFAELGKRNTLTWTPPKEFAPPTVFKVVTSSMEFDLDDWGELLGRRVYGIRLVCKPQGWSAEETIVEAEPVAGTPPTPVDTLVDACSSVTGWTTSTSGSPVVSTGGAVTPTNATAPSYLIRTGSIDLTTTPYLAVDIRTLDATGTIAIRYNETDPYHPAIASGPAASPLYTRYYFKPPFTSLSSFRIRATFAAGLRGRVQIAEVRKQNTPPASGTLRQRFFTADVPGSMPSEGTIEVSHETSSLGPTLVFTTPEADGQDFGPALRPYLFSSGTTTADASLISGASNPISTTDNVYRIPAAQVTPGTYEVGAFLKSSTTGSKTVTVTTQMVDASGAALGGSTAKTTTVTFAATGTRTYFGLNRFQLPRLRVPANVTTAQVQVTISAAGGGTIDLDEAYLFDIDHGALTVLDAATYTRVWLKAATLEDPKPSIMVGTLADESDSFAATPSAWGTHETTPPTMSVFVVTRDALAADVRLRLYAAWHTHSAL